MAEEQGEKGPAVYRGMDAATVDRQYNARNSVPSYEAEYARYVAESEAAMAGLERIDGLVYDERSGERLDIYPAGPDTPLFLWIHGGYWRACSRFDNAFAAPGLVANGISVAVMDYTLAPRAHLGEIVRQTRAAAAWLHGNASRYGLAARRLHVGGSSAGGHLTGMLIAGGWMDGFGLPKDAIGVALAISGLHELAPLRHTYVNDWMQFDAATIAANSPIRHIPERSAAHLIGSVGGLESAEFHRQTEDYVAAWRAAGHSGEIVAMPGYHHFDVALSLKDRDGGLTRAAAEAIGRLA